MSSAAAAIPPSRSPVTGSIPTDAETARTDAAPRSGAGSAETTRRVHLGAVRRVIADGGPRIVYQPQLSLSRLVVDGYEALARFPDGPIRSTESWFARARELGLGPALEASALEQALARRHERPAGTTLAVNLSPGVLAGSAVSAILPEDLTGIEIELTEHEWPSGGVGRLRRLLDRLRERGARVAIDDVGVAHSGLRRVMDLAPDRIKLDKHLVQGVAASATKTALIRAVVDFAEQINATVCAEGVENLDDLEALAELDVGYAQGWMIGLPEPDFHGADPIAIASGRDSLSRMLAGRHRQAGPSGASDPAASGSVRAPAYDTTADVEDLLAQLTRVTDLTELGALAGTCARVLGGDTVLISRRSPDGTSIRSIPTSPADTPGAVFTLADYPITRRCLETRAVIPIYLGSEGDRAEWQVLARLGFEAALLVPVISRDGVIGLLECYRSTCAPWSRRQIRSARTVAAMLGPVLDLTTPALDLEFPPSTR
jgi:EAL domain-containing protein (putative c-di-GMP-specific phosphodiesterase class I)